MFLGVAGGTIERSCYSPHYVNTERDYERDYQATLPQGRTAADGCKPRHGRDDRKRERSFSGLRFPSALFLWTILVVFGPMEKDVLYTTMIMTFTVGVDLGFVLGCFLLIFYHIASMQETFPCIFVLCWRFSTNLFAPH